MIKWTTKAAALAMDSDVVAAQAGASCQPVAGVDWAAWRKGVMRALMRPTDVAALVVFRIVFGLLVSVSAVRFIAYGWVERFFVQPRYMFKYWGFSWVRVWPAWGMYVHLGVLAVLGLCVAVGYRCRLTALLLWLCFGYLQLIDASLYLNHYYFIVLLAALLVILPLGSAGSLDVRRNPSARVRHFPAWYTYLLRFQVGLVYFYAGVAKFGSDWLVHAQPLNIWLTSHADMPLLGGLFEHWWVALLMSWAGFVYDLTIVVWLSWRRTRALAYALVWAFHLLTHILFNIGMFPLIMSACALVFFSPRWPRRWFGRWLAKADVRDRALPPPAVVDDARGATFFGGQVRRKLAFGLLGVWLVAQALIPLRHFLYPGDVLWNEQGMRWAWKVKVRAKNGAVSYRVKLADGRSQIVSPRRYLTDYQQREMSGQPDLILQLAHHIGNEYNQRGQGPVRVYADARVSLNGRAAAVLIEPDVDLMRVRDGVGVASWITPAPNSVPIRLDRRRR